MKDSLEKKNTIVFVGIMGVGKSHIGKRLAQAKQISFADSDAEIEKLSGMLIENLFKNKGEKIFRLLETQVIEDLLTNKKPKILASGGGAFIQPETHKIIQKNGLSLWLKDTNIERLANRILEQKIRRPQLEYSDIKTSLKKLMDKRYPLYEQANITLIIKNQSLDEIVQEAWIAITDYQRKNPLK